MESTNKLSKFRILHLQNLAALANIDNHIDEQEYEFLCDLAERYEIPKNIIDQIIANLGEQQPEIPALVDQRIAQLLDLVRMMMIDGKKDPKEMHFCKNVAEGFGFKKEFVEFLVNHYKFDNNNYLKTQDLIHDAMRFLHPNGI